MTVQSLASHGLPLNHDSLFPLLPELQLEDIFEQSASYTLHLVGVFFSRLHSW